MEAAKVGDAINWGSYEDYSCEKYYVGHGNYLYRKVDDLTEEDWIKRELNTKADSLLMLLAQNHITTQEYTDELDRMVGEVQQRAAMEFGDVEGELVEYCKEEFWHA